MTSEPLTPEGLDTIEARANAATEGPWEIRGHEIVRDSYGLATIQSLWIADIDPVAPADAEFIAHAREDVPALVVELRRLRTENEEQRQRIDAALVEVEATDFSTFEALQEDLADRVRAALTGEATE